VGGGGGCQIAGFVEFSQFFNPKFEKGLYFCPKSPIFTKKNSEKFLQGAPSKHEGIWGLLSY
jgi:hypothetical protein